MADNTNTMLFQGTAEESKSFQWHDGDEVIVCVEGGELRSGDKAPYCNMQLRVVLGPIGDRSRNAGPRLGDDSVISRTIFDNVSFSPKDGCRRRVASFLYAVGHDGQVGIANERDWLLATLDREMKIRIRMEEYEGKTRPRPAAYMRPTPAEMRLVANVYEEFGCARGGSWSEEPVETINPWDPTRFLGPAAAAIPPTRGRGGLQAAPPARDAVDQGAPSEPESQVPPTGQEAEDESQVEPAVDIKKKLEGMTVAQVEAWCKEAGADTDWDAVLKAEEAGRNRAKAKAAIIKAREAAAGSNPNEDDIPG